MMPWVSLCSCGPPADTIHSQGFFLVFLEFTQPPVGQEEEVPTHQHQDRSSRLDQEESEPPQLKDEQEEPCSHRDRSSYWTRRTRRLHSSKMNVIRMERG